jgi:beta-carotene ketolase (CrtO type)
MRQDFDAILIGGGHNGLTAAAYLGKFGGLKVLVLEAREILGGFATSEKPFALHPDVTINRFGVDHMHMCGGPVPQELELETYEPAHAAPFRYLWHDQAHWLYMYPEGRSILAAKDLDVTTDAVDRAFPGEGANYRSYCERWFRILDILEHLDSGPPPTNGLSGFAAGLAGADSLTQYLLSNPMESVVRGFRTDQMHGMMGWWAGQTASPPWQPGSSVLASSLAPATHLTGKARPQGGSGALSAVLADMIQHIHGGTVLPGCVVEKVIVSNGKARGVEWRESNSGKTSSASSSLVLSSADARTLFTRLVDPEAVPPHLATEVDRIGYSQVGLFKVDLLLNRSPDLAASFGPSPTGDDRDLAVATGIIAPGYESYVKPGWIDILSGKPSQSPALWCVAATELDRSLAPEGYHTLWLSQFAPKVLNAGQSWSEIGEAVALSAFRTYAAQSGLREDDIVDIVVTTPDDMARLVHSVDPYGVGMNSNQMLSFRPTPSLSQYRTPIRGLFLTGSGTHPGGGITGLPGRNAALEALAYLGRASRSPRRSRWQRLKGGLETFKKLRRFSLT